MLLTPEIISILLLNGIFFVFGGVAFYLSIKIFLQWNIDSTKSLQYKLETQSFLVATVIKYIFIIKLPLFLFFIFTQDKVSLLIPGAMCAAGVVNSTVYGLYLFVLRILNLYIFGFWLILNKIDMQKETMPYTKLKFFIFIVGFLFLMGESILEIMMFSAIDIDKIVSCCGTLFSATSTSNISKIFQLDNSLVLSLFYLNFALMLAWHKNKIIFISANIIYIFTAIISLILFFGTYIYQLPTHHCPFCFLQKDYYYVGYLLYVTLFIGTFSGISGGIIALITKAKQNKSYKTSLLFNFIYLVIVSLYVGIYYLQNGVWL